MATVPCGLLLGKWLRRLGAQRLLRGWQPRKWKPRAWEPAGSLQRPDGRPPERSGQRTSEDSSRWPPTPSWADSERVSPESSGVLVCGIETPHFRERARAPPDWRPDRLRILGRESSRMAPGAPPWDVPPPASTALGPGTSGRFAQRHRAVVFPAPRPVPEGPSAIAAAAARPGHPSGVRDDRDLRPRRPTSSPSVRSSSRSTSRTPYPSRPTYTAPTYRSTAPSVSRSPSPRVRSAPRQSGSSGGGSRSRTTNRNRN